MDTVRAIELLLELSAKAEARADRAEARTNKIDEQLKATANLVRAGMKIVFRLARNQDEAKAEMKELRADLKEIRADLKALTARGGNGRPKR